MRDANTGSAARVGVHAPQAPIVRQRDIPQDDPWYRNTLTYSAQAGQLADELKKDVDRLSKLGVLLDYTAAAAKPGGIVAGIAVGFRINPLLGVAVAGAGLLSKFATDGFKKNRINSIRQKWWRKATSMNKQQLEDFGLAIGSKYPLLLPAAQLLLGLDG